MFDSCWKQQCRNPDGQNSVVQAWSVTSFCVIAAGSMDWDWVKHFERHGEKMEAGRWMDEKYGSEKYGRLWGKDDWKNPHSTHDLTQDLNQWISLIYERCKQYEQTEPQENDTEPKKDQDYNPFDVSDRLENLKRQGGISDTSYAELKVY